MGEVSKLFIDQFHNLSGDTIGEKRRNLFLLFRQNHSSLTEEELEFVATNLKPTCYLEKTFRVEFLIHFRRFKELLQDCLDGDETVLRRVAKQDWFFQNAFNNVEAGVFVNSILPTMPYVFKFKVLRKLSVEEQQADAIFDALLKRYGILFATIFLPKCSVRKIEQTLRNHFIKLTHAQLQLLCNKEPNLIHVYFEERSKYQGNIDLKHDNPLFEYIAKKSPEVFAQLFNKYKFEITLGYKTTKKFIDSQKNAVLNNPLSYYEMLNKKALVQKLGPDLKSIFFHPAPLTSSLCIWKFILKYYPKSQRFGIFKSAYNSKFYEEFGDNIDAITEDMLELITDPTERENLAKVKLQKTGDIKYLQFVTPSYCIQEFKANLNQVTASERAEYVKHATFCCLVNKDLDKFLELCQLTGAHLKHDDSYIRANFLCQFYENEYRSILDQFDEEHWKFMMEVIAASHHKTDWLEYYDSKIRMKYLEYLIRNNKPIQGVISKYSDWADQFDYDPQTNDPKIYREILCKLLETEPLKLWDDMSNYYECLLIRCKEFNKKAPKYAINIMDYPKMVQTIQDILTRENTSTCQEEIEYIICRKDPLLEKFKMLYFKDFKSFGQTSGCLWFLKNEPKTFQKYSDNFLENLEEVEYFNHKKIWSFIKKYTHLGLDKEIVEYCKLKLETDRILSKKLNEALAILSPVDTYFEVINTYVQVSEKNSIPDDDESRDKYNTQCNLIKFLPLLRSPASVLPVALQFCKGDFLKFALCPLFSCVYRLPENQVKSLIEKLSEDETLKIHAVNLSCAVLDLETAYNYLRNMSLTSLMCLSKYLAKNPIYPVWKLIEKRLPTVNERDLSAFRWIMSAALPLEYKTKYIEAIWTFLDKYENKEMKKVMLKNINLNIVQNLQPNFAYKLIEEGIFGMEDSEDLISSLLIHMSDSDKFDFMQKILSMMKENCASSKATQRGARRKLHQFIESISKTYFEVEKADEDFERKFFEVFTSVFSSLDAFQEYVMVSFMKLKGRNVEDCGDIFVQFSRGLVEEYGSAIVNSIGSTLKEWVLPHVFKTEDEKMKLCYSIFKLKKSVEDCFLIMNLLPASEPKDKEQYKLYNEILTDLEKVTDKFILLQLNMYRANQKSFKKKKVLRRKH